MSYEDFIADFNIILNKVNGIESNYNKRLKNLQPVFHLANDKDFVPSYITFKIWHVCFNIEAFRMNDICHWEIYMFGIGCCPNHITLEQFIQRTNKQSRDLVLLNLGFFEQFFKRNLRNAANAQLFKQIISFEELPSMFEGLILP